MTPTFISIDWGFFIYNGEFDMIDLPNGERLPGNLLYHVGRSESITKGLHDLFWTQRLGLFDAVELSLRDECAIRVDRGCIRPNDFLHELTARWPDVLDAPTWYADSNRHAGQLLKDAHEAHGPLRVVSFDSNHDLGYGYRSFRERQKRFSGPYGWWDADDWLLMALAENLAAEVVVVYPDWRGYKEWNHNLRVRDYLRKYQERITVTTYSQYMQALPVAGEVIANFLARSAGWTPPYLDFEFLQLVHRFNIQACVDCTRKGLFGVYKYDNACQTRKFDYETLLEEEQDRRIVVEAVQRAHLLYAQGEQEKAHEIIAICVNAGWDVHLDLAPKYQDSFLTPKDKLTEKLQAEHRWWSGDGRKDGGGWNYSG